MTIAGIMAFGLRTLVGVTYGARLAGCYVDLVDVCD
jgi:hypothetical protein